MLETHNTAVHLAGCLCAKANNADSVAYDVQPYLTTYPLGWQGDKYTLANGHTRLGLGVLRLALPRLFGLEFKSQNFRLASAANRSADFPDTRCQKHRPASSQDTQGSAVKPSRICGLDPIKYRRTQHRVSFLSQIRPARIHTGFFSLDYVTQSLDHGRNSMPHIARMDSIALRAQRKNRQGGPGVPELHQHINIFQRKKLLRPALYLSKCFALDNDRASASLILPISLDQHFILGKFDLLRSLHRT